MAFANGSLGLTPRRKVGTLGIDYGEESALVGNMAQRQINGYLESTEGGMMMENFVPYDLPVAYFKRRHGGRWHVVIPPDVHFALCGLGRSGSGWLWATANPYRVCKECLKVLR